MRSCTVPSPQVTGVDVTAELAQLGAQNFAEDEASAALAPRLDFRHEDATERSSDETYDVQQATAHGESGTHSILARSVIAARARCSGFRGDRETLE